MCFKIFRFGNRDRVLGSGCEFQTPLFLVAFDGLESYAPFPNQFTRARIFYLSIIKRIYNKLFGTLKSCERFTCSLDCIVAVRATIFSIPENKKSTAWRVGETIVSRKRMVFQHCNTFLTASHVKSCAFSS